MARVSEPAKAASQACSPASAPQATASRRTSSAPGGPSVTTVQVPPLSRARATPCGHGPPAVGVHLDLHAGAHQPAVPELERLGQRDLLGQGRDPQRITDRPAHRWRERRPA